jgi:uncharacterized protein (TIGR02246 family)
MTQSILLRGGLWALLVLVPLVGFAQETMSDNVQMLAARWTQAYNTHNLKALGELYTEDARLMMHGSPTYVGRQRIEAFWAEDFKEGKPLTLLTVTHAVDGVDTILVHGNYQVINRENGDILGLGRFAHIWTRTAGGRWMLDRDLWNKPFEPYTR